MSMFMFVAILALNLLISWWNCKVCGEHWSESKALGGFARVLMWCGVIQSAVGLSMVLLFVEVFGAVALGYLPPKAADGAFALWYLAVIVPAIGSGIIITVHSWIVAWRERSWANMGGAAWNTFATGHNIYSAMDGIPNAFDKLGDFFSDSGDSNSKGGKLVLLLVMLSLVGGALLTMWLVNHYDVKARRELKTAIA